MISIIVCSRNKEIPSTLSININSTIGDVNYEIVWIDNSPNQYSIFEAYNLGVKKSKGKYLCFMHEDILFHSNNWGNILVNNLNNIKIGAVGIVGGYYLDHYSVYWVINTLMCGQLVHMHPNIDGTHYIKINNCHHHKDLGNYVVALDGIWLGIRKELFNNIIEWDYNTYKGFHFYDMDISLQLYQKGYKLKVLNNILIEHKSKGDLNNTFFDNCIKFHKKWDYILPIMSENIPIGYINNAKHLELQKRCNAEKYYYNSQRIFSRSPYKILSKLYGFFRIKLW